MRWQHFNLSLIIVSMYGSFRIPLMCPHNLKNNDLFAESELKRSETLSTTEHWTQPLVIEVDTAISTLHTIN